MDIKKRNYIAAAIVLLLLVGAVSGALYLYNEKLRTDITLTTFDTLHEMLDQQAFNLKARFRTDIRSAKNLAKTTRYFPNDDKKSVSMLDELRKDTNFDHILLTDLTGKGVSNNGTAVDISIYSYFQEALAGQSKLYAPLPSVVDSCIVLPVSTPVYVDGKVQGVLCGLYNVSDINNLLLSTHKGQSVTYITDSKGNILVRPTEATAPLANQFDKNNLLHRMDKAKFYKYDDRAAITAKMQAGKTGYAIFNVDGESQMMVYIPLNIHDWYIFMIVPETVVTGREKEISNKALLLTAGIVAALLLFAAYILWSQQRANRERLAHTAELERLAYYDALTGLPNLLRFKLLAQELLKQNPKQTFVMAKFDILNFKVINEMFGYEVGNAVLREAATQMQETGRQLGCDQLILARVNADEFILLDEFKTDMQDLHNRTTQFQQQLLEKTTALLGAHRVEFRYGRYLPDPSDYNVDDMIEKVNLAHRIAKRKKSATVCDFDESFKRQILRETELINRMDAALQAEDFKVFLQPKFSLKSERVVGAEALVRWQEKEGGLISPGDFIPLFERNGAIVQLDMYMYERVCRLLREWLDEGRPVVPISVNLSRLHLQNSRLVQELADLAERYQIPKHLIEIELTESVIYDNEEKLQELLKKLHTVGFMLSMDDFGTGYSSLGLLKDLRVDVIKIDRSFFTGNKHIGRAKSVIESVMQMAKKLNIQTVAEGVEEKEHIDFLKEVGCNIVQGFYYARPLPAEEFYTVYGDILSDMREEHAHAATVSKELLEGFLPYSANHLLHASMRQMLQQRHGEESMQDVLYESGKAAAVSYVQAHETPDVAADNRHGRLERLLSGCGIAAEMPLEGALAGETFSLHIQRLQHAAAGQGFDDGMQYESGFVAGLVSLCTGVSYEVKACIGEGKGYCCITLTSAHERSGALLT